MCHELSHINQVLSCGKKKEGNEKRRKDEKQDRMTRKGNHKTNVSTQTVF
jgi:hypothetical protein